MLHPLLSGTRQDKGLPRTGTPYPKPCRTLAGPTPPGAKKASSPDSWTGSAIQSASAPSWTSAGMEERVLRAAERGNVTPCAGEDWQTHLCLASIAARSRDPGRATKCPLPAMTLRDRHRIR